MESKYLIRTDINIDSAIQSKWQRILNLLSADLIIPIASIMQVHEKDIEVFVSNVNVAHPYRPGTKQSLDTDLYCETVMDTRQPLIVSNALKREQWKDRTDIEHGLIAYMGFPIQWPTGELFGTICVLDYKERDFTEVNKNLLEEFAGMIQDDLTSLITKMNLTIKISEHINTLNALLESETRLRRIFNTSQAGFLITREDDGTILDVNKGYMLLSGYEREELIGKTTLERHLYNKPEERQLILMELANNEKIVDHEIALLTKSGQSKVLRASIEKMELDHIQCLLTTVYDISALKEAEKCLVESEARFRLFVENAPDGVFVETDSHLAYVNRRTIELFSAHKEEDLLGLYVPNLFTEEHREIVMSRINTLRTELHSVPLREECIIRSDGTTLDVEVSAVPLKYNGRNGALVFMRDISDRKLLEKDKIEMEMQLRQKQKLESIGTLAGGVAHEINNPINGIINYAQLIQLNPGSNEKITELSAEIIHEGERIAEIVKNLLYFSRQEKQMHSPAHIEDIVNRTLSLIQTILRHDAILLDVNIPEGLPQLKCRSQQIQQVIMNLITNARDALNEKYKGHHEDKKILMTCVLFNFEERRWLRLVVEDHGNGIQHENLDKVFDPFFTTKPREKGTGLGLSISHGIVKDHHGELYFDTKPGEYTRAILELPIDNGWTIE